MQTAPLASVFLSTDQEEIEGETGRREQHTK